MNCLILVLALVQSQGPLEGYPGTRIDRSDDATFLRRVTLDLISEVPEPEETRAFLADGSPDKRERKAKELLGSRAFARAWSQNLTSAWVGYPRAGITVDLEAFSRWLEKRLTRGASYADVVREVLTASGTTFNRPEASFLYQFVTVNDPFQSRLRIEDATGKIASSFLGYRLQCAQCHDHPFDRWTQEDFYGLAAFFENTRTRSLGLSIGDDETPTGYRFEAYALPPSPRYLDGRPPQSPDRRQELARLLTSDLQFSRAAVNMLWARLFGRGLVDPFNDFASPRGKAVPPVLETLAREFADGGHDLRKMLYRLVTSNVYQRRDAPLRPLTPEQHFGALVRATRLEEAILDEKVVGDLLSPFETLYGSRRPLPLLRRWFLGMLARTSEAGSPASFHEDTANNLQVFRLLDAASPIYTGVRAGSEGRLTSLLAERRTAAETVSELYRCTLSRDPTPAELERSLAAVGQPGADARPWERLFWALLNCDEFLFNH